MKRIAFVFICLLVLSLTAQAESLIISLEELRDTAPNIVFATFKGAVDGSTDIWSASAYNLEVLQVIKGDLKPGIVEVNVGSGHATLQPGQQLICFLTEDLRFSWCAAPLGFNPDPMQDLWKIRGFYDFNAYIVTKCTLSLPVMRAFFLDRRYLPYRIEGPICFFDPLSRSMKPSAYEFQIEVGNGKVARVQSNLPLHDFANQNWAKAIGDCWGATPFMRLESPKNGRHLEISAEIVGLDHQTGTYQCRFWTTGPAFYQEQTLLTFLADSKLVYPWYEIEVKAPDGGKWTLSLDLEPGRIGTLSGTPWGTLEFAEISDEPISFITGWGGTERLALVTELNRNDALGLSHIGTDASIIQNLMIAPMSAKVYRDVQGKPTLLGPATLTLKDIHFGDSW